MLVLFFSSSANADWIMTSKNPSGTTEFYIDKDNIRKDKSTRYFWMLFNYKDREVDRKYNSAMNYVQLDYIVL